MGLSVLTSFSWTSLRGGRGRRLVDQLHCGVLDRCVRVPLLADGDCDDRDSAKCDAGEGDCDRDVLVHDGSSFLGVIIVHVYLARQT